MKVYNEDRTMELAVDELDLTKGKLITESETIHIKEIKGQEAKGYFNPADNNKWVETQAYVKAVPEHNETIYFQRYIPYTDKELAEIQTCKELNDLMNEMEELDKYLKETDYQAIKCAERGLSMESEYPEEFKKRQEARDRINEIRSITGRARRWQRY